MKNYTIKVLEETVTCDSDMEESYGMVNVLDSNNKIVGEFQMCNTEIFDEKEYIKELESLNIKGLMNRPLLNDMPKQIKGLHNILMQSSNLCIYASDMVEWWDTEEDFGQTWDEFVEWLEVYVMEHKELEGLIDFTDGDNDYIVFGDFMSAFNLHEVKVDWEEVAQNLLSLAETLDYVGDYEDLRDRLRKECELTEKQLDIIGV